ncbi:MAG: GspH/FimT family protein [Thermodesulfobacteriota bacterium]
MSRKRRNHRTGGFTVIELLIAVGIVAVLAAVAVPLITANVPRFQLKGAARILATDFQKAKVEAVKRNCNVEMRFTPGAYDPAGEIGSYQLVEMAGGSVLVSRTMPKYVTLYATNFGGTPGYNPQGLPLNSLQGSVYLVNVKGTSYKISLSTAGHVGMTMNTVDTGALNAW